MAWNKLDGLCAGCGTQLERKDHLTCRDCWQKLRTRKKKLIGFLPNTVSRYRVAKKNLLDLKRQIGEALEDE